MLNRLYELQAGNGRGNRGGVRSWLQKTMMTMIMVVAINDNVMKIQATLLDKDAITKWSRTL